MTMVNSGLKGLRAKAINVLCLIPSTLVVLTLHHIFLSTGYALRCKGFSRSFDVIYRSHLHHHSQVSAQIREKCYKILHNRWTLYKSLSNVSSLLPSCHPGRCYCCQEYSSYHWIKGNAEKWKR